MFYLDKNQQTVVGQSASTAGPADDRLLLLLAAAAAGSGQTPTSSTQPPRRRGPGHVIDHVTPELDRHDLGFVLRHTHTRTDVTRTGIVQDI